ncbi:MAG TPA: orotidine 5'-phosphate decarboxylase, partial [Segetibacter sp.]
DSLRPFLEYEDKWTIVLGLTSNKGSEDFEQLRVHTPLTGEQFLYEAVMDKVAGWGTTDNLMFVVGATKPEQLAAIRTRFPHHFFLVPGLGSQGGNLQEVSKAALRNEGGILVNASRAIMYADSSERFAEEAKSVAGSYAEEMKTLLMSH